MVTIIVIAVVLVFGCFKFGPFILDFIKMIRRDAYQCNPNAQENLSREKITALSAGLIIAEQNLFYSNTLETGASKNEQIEKLRSHWGIENSQDALQRLASFGSVHQLYDAAINTYLSVNKSDWRNYININYSENTGEIYDYLLLLDKVSEVLIKNKVATDEQEMREIFQKGSIAWDLGRIVYIARASYTCGYITAQQAWQTIDAVLPQVKKHFADWKAFGQSYMLGRAIWSHDDAGIEGLFMIYTDVIKEEASPWLKYPL